MSGVEASSQGSTAPVLLLSDLPAEFALLRRPDTDPDGGAAVELLAGPVRELADLDSVPSPDHVDGSPVRRSACPAQRAVQFCAVPPRIGTHTEWAAHRREVVDGSAARSAEPDLACCQTG